MNRLYMLCGVPGSGKTTFRERQFDKNALVLSTDDTIQKIATLFDLNYDDCFQDCIKFAENRIEKMLQHEFALQKKYERSVDIVWDQTNLTVKSRAKKLAKFEGKNYRKIIYVFPTPSPGELEIRLWQRSGKTIPKHILDSMIASFEYPTLEEGWDEIRPYSGGI
jgi:predicted kinase